VGVDTRVRLVARHLDPVLRPAGFGRAQGGARPDGPTQVLYCAGHDDLVTRFPALPHAADHDNTGGCIDLTIDIDRNGTLSETALEHESLEETLTHVGHRDHAAAVERVVGQPIEAALPVLAESLALLFPASD